MKKPRSFLKAVASANADRVTVLGMSGKAYLASLPPLPALGSSIGQLPPAPALPTAPAPTAALPRSATSSTTSKSDS